MRRLVRIFSADDRGVTALEYGLIAALVAVAIIGAISSLGKNASTVFSTVSHCL